MRDQRTAVSPGVPEDVIGAHGRGFDTPSAPGGDMLPGGGIGFADPGSSGGSDPSGTGWDDGRLDPHGPEQSSVAPIYTDDHDLDQTIEPDDGIHKASPDSPQPAGDVLVEPADPNQNVITFDDDEAEVFHSFGRGAEPTPHDLHEPSPSTTHLPTIDDIAFGTGEGEVFHAGEPSDPATDPDPIGDQLLDPLYGLHHPPDHQLLPSEGGTDGPRLFESPADPGWHHPVDDDPAVEHQSELWDELHRHDWTHDGHMPEIEVEPIP
jgi:hypothetical protein